MTRKKIKPMTEQKEDVAYILLDKDYLLIESIRELTDAILLLGSKVK